MTCCSDNDMPAVMHIPGVLGVGYNPGFAAEADEVIYAQKHP
jgi:hypothetical protein